MKKRRIHTEKFRDRVLVKKGIPPELMKEIDKMTVPFSLSVILPFWFYFGIFLLLLTLVNYYFQWMAIEKVKYPFILSVFIIAFSFLAAKISGIRSFWSYILNPKAYLYKRTSEMLKEIAKNAPKDDEP